MNRSHNLALVILLSVAIFSVLNMPNPAQATVIPGRKTLPKGATLANAISIGQTANSTVSSTQSTSTPSTTSTVAILSTSQTTTSIQLSTVTSTPTSTSQTITTPTSSITTQSITITSVATTTSVATVTSVATTTTSVATTTSTSVATTTSSTSSTLATSTTTTQTTSIVSPTITLNPSSSSTGATVEVTGSEFSSSDTSCSLSGGAVASQTCTISDGILAGSFTVATGAAGPYQITATGNPAGDTASASFIVSTLPPSITLNPTSASQGATVQVSGSDFLTSDSSCSISGTAVSYYTCSVSGGALTGTFTVAAAGTGTYTITAVGSPGDDSASTSFTIVAGTSPSATLSTSSAAVGTTVDVSGSGFSTSDTSCYVSSSAATTSTCSIYDGTFSASFVVANVAASDYTVTITGEPSYDSASATLAVGETGPQITLSASSAEPGAVLDVSGSGFNTADNYCSLTGTPVTSETCSISDGTLTGSFTVADVAVTAYTITATGTPEDDSASATLTLGTLSGTASITFNPTSARVGTTVSVTGTGFSSSDTSCTLTGTIVSSESCTMSDGTFTASFVVASVSPGSYLVTATGSPESDYTAVYFTVLTPSPTVTLNPSSASVGATVQVSGTGFSASDSGCSLSGTAVSASSCSISNGALTGSFTVSNVSLASYTVTATGSPIGDSGSSTLTIVTPAVTTSTTSAIPDFSLSSTASVVVPQGQYVSVPITLTSLNGFSSSVTMAPVWVGTIPSGANLSISSPIALASGGTATSSLGVSTSSTATTGTFTVQVGGTSGSLTHTITITIVIQAVVEVTTTTSSTMTTSSSLSSSSTSQTTTSAPTIPVNCPVSSATSGSALAPIAQAMRTFRDQSILRTRTGADFMIIFNSWYYSFSPTLAAHIQTHPTQRAIFRDALYPLLGILYASYYSYLLLSPVSTEVGAALAGVVAAGLIGLVYLAPVSYLCSRMLRHKFRSLHLTPSRLYAWVAVSIAMTGFAYSTGEVLLLSIAATNLVLCTLTLGCMLGTLALTHLQSFCPRFPSAGWTVNEVKMIPYYATRTLSRILHPLEILRRTL